MTSSRYGRQSAWCNSTGWMMNGEFEEQSSQESCKRSRFDLLNSNVHEISASCGNAISVASKTCFTQVDRVVKNKPCLMSKLTARLARDGPFLFCGEAFCTRILQSSRMLHETRSLKIDRDQVRAFSAKNGGSTSSQSSGQPSPSSDADVLISLQPDEMMTLEHFLDMRDELSAMFGGREVDFVQKRLVKTPFRRHEILAHWKVLPDA